MVSEVSPPLLIDAPSVSKGDGEPAFGKNGAVAIVGKKVIGEPVVLEASKEKKVINKDEKETLRLVEFPRLQDAWFFDQNGNKVKEKVATKMPVSIYWTHKLPLIGLLLMVSTGILLLIFLNESKLFEIFWGGTIGFFLKLLGWA